MKSAEISELIEYVESQDPRMISVSEYQAVKESIKNSFYNGDISRNKMDRYLKRLEYTAKKIRGLSCTA